MEVVQTDQRHADRHAGHGRREPLRQQLQEQRPVRQTGRAVVHRIVDELRLQALLLAEVGERAAHPHGAAIDPLGHAACQQRARLPALAEAQHVVETGPLPLQMSVELGTEQSCGGFVERGGEPGHAALG